MRAAVCMYCTVRTCRCCGCWSRQETFFVTAAVVCVCAAVRTAVLLCVLLCVLVYLYILLLFATGNLFRSRCCSLCMYCCYAYCRTAVRAAVALVFARKGCNIIVSAGVCACCCIYVLFVPVDTAAVVRDRKPSSSLLL